MNPLAAVTNSAPLTGTTAVLAPNHALVSSRTTETPVSAATQGRQQRVSQAFASYAKSPSQLKPANVRVGSHAFLGGSAGIEVPHAEGTAAPHAVPSNAAHAWTPFHDQSKKDMEHVQVVGHALTKAGDRRAGAGTSAVAHGNEPVRILTVQDMRPGDVVCVSEHPTPFQNRALTHRLQGKTHNSLTDAQNKGNVYNYHNFIWTKHPQNPGNVQARGPGEPQIVEGHGSTPDTGVSIMRMQGTAAKHNGASRYLVYRPTDPNLGSWAAQIAMCWAQGNVEYANKGLVEGRMPSEFGPEAQHKATVLAREAFEPDPMWARNPENMAPMLREGVVCSTAVGKVYQAAQLNILKAVAHETGESVSFSDLTARLTGLAGSDVTHMSPRTLEHRLIEGRNPDGSKQFEFIGELVVDKELYPETPFPFPAKQSGRLPATDPRSAEFQQAKKASKL